MGVCGNKGVQAQRPSGPGSPGWDEEQGAFGAGAGGEDGMRQEGGGPQAPLRHGKCWGRGSLSGHGVEKKGRTQADHDEGEGAQERILEADVLPRNLSALSLHSSA